jgi:hypothetical protein
LYGKALATEALQYNHFSYLPSYEDGTKCSETTGYKIQTPENYPEGNIQRSEQSESLKSRKLLCPLQRTGKNGKETTPLMEQSFERLKSVSVAKISSSAVRLEFGANVHGI